MINLKSFFDEHPVTAIAFSGGVDSAYLLYEALRYARSVRAYYVKSAFQPDFETEDARRLARELGADMKIIQVDILTDRSVCDNPANRCYFCKKKIFGEILKAAADDGFHTICDGTNASDQVLDRPGMKALEEMQVFSPLRLAGLTKEEIRRLSKEEGLFTWNKPAYACLATRIRTGEEITAEKLAATEEAEKLLFSLGFSDFRVRRRGDAAVIQVCGKDLDKVLINRTLILDSLKENYDSAMLDLETRDEQ